MKKKLQENCSGADCKFAVLMVFFSRWRDAATLPMIYRPTMLSRESVLCFKTVTSCCQFSGEGTGGLGVKYPIDD